MKKRIADYIFFSTVLVFGIVIIGCSSVSTKHMDPNVPWQEQALILTADGPGGWNEILRVDGRASKIRTNSVGVIPAGHRSLQVNRGIAGSRRQARDTVQFDFAPGGRYVIQTDGPRAWRGNRDPVQIMTLNEFQTYWSTEGAGSRVREDRKIQTFEANYLSKFNAAESALNK